MSVVGTMMVPLSVAKGFVVINLVFALTSKMVVEAVVLILVVVEGWWCPSIDTGDQLNSSLSSHSAVLSLSVMIIAGCRSRKCLLSMLLLVSILGGGSAQTSDSCVMSPFGAGSAQMSDAYVDSSS